MTVPLRQNDSAPEVAALAASARHTLKLEIRGLEAIERAMARGLAPAFEAAIAVLRQATGRVIVTGMGKSGHVGQKVAATLTSTGTPAYFVHPSEASHGDLGMITREDVVLAFSWSGETVELTNLINYSRRFAVPLIAVTACAESSLATAAEVTLALPRVQEACPHGLAPTTSTIMQMALGDCLAVALIEGRGFTATDFKTFHPGGQLGAKLKLVSDLMHKGDQMPLAAETTRMSEALVIMTEKSLGCLGITGADGRLVGILTDGDLRRNMGANLLAARVGEIMTKNPKTIAPDMLASAALEVINSSSITALFIVEGTRPIGIIHIHDLLRAGVA